VKKHVKNIDPQVNETLPMTALKLYNDICQLIEQSRANVALTVNRELTLLYWQIGHLINTEILQFKRAEYGEQIIATLSHQLSSVYGKGFTRTALVRMKIFSETFSFEEISATLSHKFSWSHFVEFIGIKDELKRSFYIELCSIEKWSVRQLRERINSMLYERTAISKKPDETIKQEHELLKQKQQITPDLIFRDPYFLDFLGLNDTYSEKDLESAIIIEMQKFIIELGYDFAFLARQKRITIDNRDYKIDLLFYHRRLKCLVVIDLKLSEFEAGYKGQMELYLRYLEKHETLEGENPPVGLILCAGKNEEHVDLLQLDKSNIRIAEYLTVLPPKELLLKKLHYAIAAANQRIHNLNNEN
jgi:predicted nuclease of restriction endonuclease-like (RecB) superfamily